MLNTPLVNYDAVGRCADILKLNPIELSTSQLSELAFDLGDLKDNKAVLGPISYSLPERLEFRIDAGADRDKTVSELSSSYDFQTFLKSSAAIQVSDPAGSLYSASASAAFEDCKSNTTKNNNVVTYASITVWLWWLKVLDETPLSDRLKTAFQQLPVDDEGPYEKLIAKFGTHYLREAFFGGRATQVIKVSTVDYAGLIQRNVDISVQAALTLGLKASAAAESKDTEGRIYKINQFDCREDQGDRRTFPGLHRFMGRQHPVLPDAGQKQVFAAVRVTCT